MPIGAARPDLEPDLQAARPCVARPGWAGSLLVCNDLHCAPGVADCATDLLYDNIDLGEEAVVAAAQVRVVVDAVAFGAVKRRAAVLQLRGRR
jgi:hypothetical protein